MNVERESKIPYIYFEKWSFQTMMEKCKKKDFPIIWTVYSSIKYLYTIYTSVDNLVSEVSKITEIDEEKIENIINEFIRVGYIKEEEGAIEIISGGTL